MIKMGPKKAAVLPPPVEAMSTTGFFARVWTQRSTWKGRGPDGHCGMHFSVISRATVRPTGVVPDHGAVWVELMAEGSFAQYSNVTKARYTWCIT